MRQSQLTAAILIGALVIAGGIVAADLGGSSPDQQMGANSPPGQAAATPPDANDRGIAVGAAGEAEAEPDAAEIRLSVEATADDPTTARDRVARNVSAMREALQEAGISEEDIQTLDFDVHQEYRPRRPREGSNDEPEKRYRARHDFRIDTSVDRVGTVTDTALDNGATTVGNVRFTLTTEARREVRKAALKDAMSNARGQAQTLAEQSNLTITRVRTVSTGDANVEERRYDGAMAATPTAVEGDSARTKLESGPVTVHVSVDVTYDATEP